MAASPFWQGTRLAGHHGKERDATRPGCPGRGTPRPYMKGNKITLPSRQAGFVCWEVSTMLRFIATAGLVLLSTSAWADNKADCFSTIRTMNCASKAARRSSSSMRKTPSPTTTVERLIRSRVKSTGQFSDHNKAIELNPNYAPAYIAEVALTRARATTSTLCRT